MFDKIVCQIILTGALPPFTLGSKQVVDPKFRFASIHLYATHARLEAAVVSHWLIGRVVNVGVNWLQLLNDHPIM